MGCTQSLIEPDPPATVIIEPHRHGGVGRPPTAAMLLWDQQEWEVDEHGNMRYTPEAARILNSGSPVSRGGRTPSPSMSNAGTPTSAQIAPIPIDHEGRIIRVVNGGIFTREELRDMDVEPVVSAVSDGDHDNDDGGCGLGADDDEDYDGDAANDPHAIASNSWLNKQSYTDLVQ